MTDQTRTVAQVIAELQDRQSELVADAGSMREESDRCGGTYAGSLVHSALKLEADAALREQAADLLARLPSPDDAVRTALDNTLAKATPPAPDLAALRSRITARKNSAAESIVWYRGMKHASATAHWEGYCKALNWVLVEVDEQEKGGQ